LSYIIVLYIVNDNHNIRNCTEGVNTVRETQPRLYQDNTSLETATVRQQKRSQVSIVHLCDMKNYDNEEIDEKSRSISNRSFSRIVSQQVVQWSWHVCNLRSQTVCLYVDGQRQAG